MGFVAKELASGTIASGSTGANTIYTAPGSTTAHVIMMTLKFGDQADSAVVEINGIPAAQVQPTVADVPYDLAASDQDNTESIRFGTVGNVVVETGDTIVVVKTGSGGEIDYIVCGYEIT